MFIVQLTHLCLSFPTRSKWVFVPGHALGNTLGERLAREGVSWANLRFVTPLDIAVRMAGPFLLERGVDPSDDTLGPALVMRLLLDRPAYGGYFRPMAEHPSMADALWRAILELRLAGVTAASLSASAFESPEKHRELAALLEAYERHLEGHHVADAAIVFEEAVHGGAFCPIGDADLRMEWPDVIWPPLVRRFLDALPGQQLLSERPDVPGRLFSRRAAGPVAGSVAAAPAVRRDADRLRWLMQPGAAPPQPGPPDGSLQLFHAGGREAEIDEVFRRVLASGLPLDEIEIACASGAHALLAWEKAARLGWRATLSSGVPAALTRPGRALLRWCDWIDLDLAATRLRHLLQSGDIAPAALAGEDDEDGRTTAGQAARLLLRAEAAWGRETYAPAFARLRAFYGDRVSDEERDQEQRERDAITLRRIDRLDAWVGGLLANIPREREDGTVDLQALVVAARAFLGENAARASALDAAAQVAIDDSLAELASLGAFSTSLRSGLRFLRERVDHLQVAADRARPASLHVSDLTGAGLSGRGLVFVVGLEEGRVFPPSVEDAVLLDSERARVHEALRRSQDRLDEAVGLVVTRLATIGTEARHGIVLSFSCRDTREFRETFPSWLVLQAFRLLRGDATLTHGDLADWLGEPASAVPPPAAVATADAGWWLAHAARAPARTAAAVLRAFPALVAGREAERGRASDDFTPWDGHAPEAGRALDIARRARGISPSTLEDAAACPFRFFLRQGLGVQPLEEEEREVDRWLDPPRRGRELHDLFAEVMRDLRARKRRPSVRVDVPRIVELGRRRLEQLKGELPPPSEEVFGTESDEFLYDLRLFMELECAREQEGIEPVAFEVGFGLPIEDPTLEPLATDEGVVVPLGRGRRVTVHGRIDRIDRLADGTFETIDYKTGGYWAGRWKGTFAGGTRLQHALYGLAAAKMLARRFARPRVVRNSYVFPSARGLQHRKSIPTLAPELVTEVLQDLADVLAAGTFVHAPDEDACHWCEFAPACGTEPWERASAKVGAAPALKAYRKLASHE